MSRCCSDGLRRNILSAASSRLRIPLVDRYSEEHEPTRHESGLPQPRRPGVTSEVVDDRIVHESGGGKDGPAEPKPAVWSKEREDNVERGESDQDRR